MDKKYRAWYIINPPDEPMFEYVDSPEKCAEWIKKEILYQSKLSYVYENVFGLEVFEDGEWCEWYNEYGEDVLFAFDL